MVAGVPSGPEGETARWLAPSSAQRGRSGRRSLQIGLNWLGAVCRRTGSAQPPLAVYHLGARSELRIGTGFGEHATLLSRVVTSLSVTSADVDTPAGANGGRVEIQSTFKAAAVLHSVGRAVFGRFAVDAAELPHKGSDALRPLAPAAAASRPPAGGRRSLTGLCKPAAAMAWGGAGCAAVKVHCDLPQAAVPCGRPCTVRSFVLS
jgi:hypothetical protein